MNKILSFLLALVLFSFLYGCGNHSTATAYKIEKHNEVIAAKFDTNNNAYVPMMDGTSTFIQGEMVTVRMTADHQHIIGLEKDGLLFLTTPELEEKTKISEKATEILDVNDYALLYRDEDEKTHRFIFSDNSDFTAGKTERVYLAEHSGNIVFAADKDIFILPENGMIKEKIGSYGDSCIIAGVSEDLSIVVFSDVHDKLESIYLWENGERQKLNELECTSLYGYYGGISNAVFSKDDQLVVIGNIRSDIIYIKKPGQEVVEAKLGNDLYTCAFYSESGNIEDENGQDIDGFYTLVDSSGGNGKNLYYIKVTGEREKVISDINAFSIQNGMIYYTDSESTLYSASLQGASVSNEKKIASDVRGMRVAKDGSTAFYMRNVENDVGTLYVIEKQKEPVKIASDVYISNYVSLDGKTVFYYKDTEYIKKTYTTTGTFYAYDIGKQESTKIAGEAIVGWPTSGIREGFLKDSFVFKKYSAYEKETLLCNWCYWNGNEVSVFAKDIIY